MKYADLKICMAEFRLGHITRAEMVAAIALWQRPVDCARPSGGLCAALWALLGCGDSMKEKVALEETEK